MLRHVEDEVRLLLNSLCQMGDLTGREIKIGMLCYNIGRNIREQEIINNRNLFAEFDEDEQKPGKKGR